MWNELHKSMRRAIIVTSFILFVLILVSSLLGCSSMTGAYHEWRTDIKQTADLTRYETRKEVEDTCRATIVSYETDKLMWEQYKDSDNDEERSWANSAKIRANKAAITYNEYYLKNSFVFDGNVPADIRSELEIIK